MLPLSMSIEKTLCYYNEPVKVQAPGQAMLTTQLYFPGESRNTSDSIFAPDLLMQVQSTPNGQLATFNFVLALR